MKRVELAVSLGIALVGACMEPNVPGGTEPVAEPGTNAAGVVAGPQQQRYVIQEIPAASPATGSRATRAICARNSVVGSLEGSSSAQGMVFDGTEVTQLPTFGGAVSRAHGGNARGAIVGEASIGNSTHGFMYLDGALTDLGTLGGAYSGAYAINSSGLIVGQSTLITGGDVPSHATLWEDCQPIDLGTLGGAESFARDINDAGVVVGAASRADDPVHAHAAVWRDRVIEQLDAGDAIGSQAAAINASGTIVGFAVYVAGEPWHAVMWRNGTMIDLGNFGSSAFALGLNDRGDAVGMAWDAAGTRPRPFLYTVHDELVDLEPLVANTDGWVLHQATDVCNDGRIVGNGRLDGQSRGFVLTPVH